MKDSVVAQACSTARKVLAANVARVPPVMSMTRLLADLPDHVISELADLLAKLIALGNVIFSTSLTDHLFDPAQYFVKFLFAQQGKVRVALAKLE